MPLKSVTSYNNKTLLQSYKIMERKYSFDPSGLKAVVAENVHPQAIAIFERQGYPVTTYPKSLSENELKDVLPGTRVLCIRSNTKLNRKAVESGKNLLVAGAFCVGTNQIDLDACTEHGITVFNDPISNTRSVAELVMSEITMLSRGIPDKSQKMHEGIWDKSAKDSTEMRGKTLGIVGYGNVGSQLSEMAEAAGMKVIYYDIADTLSRGNALKMETLGDVLKEADVVSLHVDGRKKNTNPPLIRKEEFDIMKEGAIFLNLSRGSVVDVEALAEKIKLGKIKGAAIDVFPHEPSSKDEEFNSPLRGLPNVILTPHIGGSTEEAQERIGGFVARKIVDFINTGNTMGSVNMPNVQPLPQEDRHRLLHIHENDNIPRIIADINHILSNRGVKGASTSSNFNSAVGYAIFDIDKGYDKRALRELRSVPGTIRSRVLY